MEDKKFIEYLNKYSEMNQRVVYSGGMSTCGALGVVFVTLKLLGFINWSWLLVLFPFWGPIAIAVTVVACIIPFAFYAAWKEVKNTSTEKEDTTESTESRTDTVNPFTQEGSLVLNPDSNYLLTPEFNPIEPAVCDRLKEEIPKIKIKASSKNKFSEDTNTKDTKKEVTDTKVTTTEILLEEPEEKPKKKRSNKRKSKKNVESNTTAETDSNK